MTIIKSRSLHNPSLYHNSARHVLNSSTLTLSPRSSKGQQLSNFNGLSQNLKLKYELRVKGLNRNSRRFLVTFSFTTLYRKITLLVSVASA